MNQLGHEMHTLCRKLFPICRSITGNGFRQSLAILKQHIPQMKQFEIPSDTKCFDWNVPREWNIKDAYVISPDGSKILDFKQSNLHVVGYSIPVNKTVSLQELQEHLHSLPEQPDAIPYVTSYYEERWGFCISENQRQKLKRGSYKVVIKSELTEGSMTYGELILPGESQKEVFLSSYLCHPSMANNELSGPVVTTFLSKWILGLERRQYTYRIIIVPETIGSICYLSRNHERMKERIIAGFNITCVGDDRAYSYLPSRQGNTLADRTALHVLKHVQPNYVTYSYLDRGSDERQYCSPGMDLPLCSIMRTKYGCYPEYHTSLDDLTLVTPEGLYGGYKVLKKVIKCLEMNETFRTTVYCEPQLGRRGMYPTLSTKNSAVRVRNMMNLLAYADGNRDLIDIAEIVNVPVWELTEIVEELKKQKLVEPIC